MLNDDCNVLLLFLFSKLLSQILGIQSRPHMVLVQMTSIVRALFGRLFKPSTYIMPLQTRWADHPMIISEGILAQNEFI